VGDDPNCHYVGHSAVIDSRGKAIAEDLTERQTTVSATIDIDELNCFR
jgi:predicted amidohydrolase